MLDSEHIFYISGGHFVIQKVKDASDQKFILMNGELNSCTFFEVISYNKINKKNIKCACAFDVSQTKIPLVKVFKHNKHYNYNLQHSHLSQQFTFRSLKFANNSKNLITLATTATDSSVQVWSIKELNILFLYKY